MKKCAVRPQRVLPQSKSGVSFFPKIKIGKIPFYRATLISTREWVPSFDKRVSGTREEDLPGEGNCPTFPQVFSRTVRTVKSGLVLFNKWLLARCDLHLGRTRSAQVLLHRLVCMLS